MKSSRHAWFELSVAWGDTTLCVHHLRDPRAFRIGPDSACDLYAPLEYTRSESVPVLLEGQGRSLRVVIPPEASARVQLPGQPSIDLEEALHRGLVQPCPDVDRARQVFLVPGMRVTIRLSRSGHDADTPYRRQAGIDDSLVISIAWVDAPRWRNVWQLAAIASVILTLLGSAAVHAGALATLAYYKPDLQEDDVVSLDHRFIHEWYAVSNAFAENPDPPEPVTADDVTEPGSPVIDDEPGSSGQMGELHAPDTRSGWGIMGPRDNPDPHIARFGGAIDAYWWTTHWYWAPPHEPWPESLAPFFPWGRDDALGADPKSARGSNHRGTVATSRGAGGQGRKGLASSANARGEGAGALESGTCADSKPVLVPGVPTISGDATLQAIRPVVRQNLARFQSCYEMASIERPSLRGRVIVQAVIGSDGQVEQVRDGGSNLAAPEVVECVVQTFGTLVFPQVKQGPVSVSWPFVAADG